MSSIEFSPRLRPWAQLKRTLPPAERLDVFAIDGQRLALFRVPAKGTPRAPVLLLHGLAANRFAFHWPGRSLAAFLSERGFECYVGELRGAGESLALQPTWDFFEYLERDVPALLGAVRQRSGFAKVHFVGHSMGGLLMMCHALTGGAAGLLSGVAIASALDYSSGGSGFEGLQQLKPLLERFTSLPYGAAMQLVAPFLGGPHDRLARFNFSLGNCEVDTVRAVHANVFGPLPPRLLLSLEPSLQAGGMKARTGLPFLSLAGGSTLPMLFAAASDDQQCPLQGLEATARALRGQVLHFGRKHGHALEYGHFDLLLGRFAPTDVWPPLAQWLECR